MSLVDVDVAHGLPVREEEVDSLDERAGAHVVQEGVRTARAEERRVREAVCVRRLGERYLRPRSEVAARGVATVHRRGDRGHPSLALVWRCVARYHIGFDGKVVIVGDEAPDFFVAVDAVKDDISVFVLAVGSGTNIVLWNSR